MIKVQNLSRAFGDFKAVDNVSFEVAAGEIVAFLGPNGAGKSTTIRMLTDRCDAYRPDDLRVDGIRAALINRSHFGASLDVMVLLGFAAALTTWRFSKIEV